MVDVASYVQTWKDEILVTLKKNSERQNKVIVHYRLYKNEMES